MELFCISEDAKLEKILYIFSKESCSYISEHGNPKKFFIFQETELSYISGKVYSEP